MHEAQLPACRIPAQAHRARPDSQLVAVGRKVIEQAAHLIDNLRHRRLGRERVFDKHDVNPVSKRALGNERKILLVQALPVAAVDENQGWRVGVATAEQVETLSRELAIMEIPLTLSRLVQARAARLETGKEVSKTRHRIPVVVRCVERNAVHSSIQHRHLAVSCLNIASGIWPASRYAFIRSTSAGS